MQSSDEFFKSFPRIVFSLNRQKGESKLKYFESVNPFYNTKLCSLIRNDLVQSHFMGFMPTAEASCGNKRGKKQKY